MCHRQHDTALARLTWASKVCILLWDTAAFHKTVLKPVIIFIVKDNAFGWQKILELSFPNLHTMNLSTVFLTSRSKDWGR